MTPDLLTFDSNGTACEGWHFAATVDDPATENLTTESGRPIVVMAHGFGGTKDSGLEPFAVALAQAGIDVLAFDYRGFGGSDGHPRQVISLTGQAQDYRAAIAAARRLPGIDPGRVALWGVSLSGGTVLEVAAGDPGIAAVVSLTPLVSGPAAALAGRKLYQPSASLRATGRALAAKVRPGPRLLPIVADPGQPAVLPLSGMKQAYLAIAGPTWRNEVDAGVVLDVLAHRPARFAGQVACPVLVQIADFDRCAPPHAAAAAAFKAGAVVHHYPADHFDVYAGSRWHEPVVAHQLRFLRRVLTPSPSADHLQEPACSPT